MTESVASAGRLLVGRYRFDRLLGHGGMGWVWSAHDETLGRDVAVKEVVPPPDLTPEQREMIRRRTLREARAAARIAHPSAVTVYDVVEEDGRPYIVMQLLPSRTLADILTEDGPLPPARAARIGVDLLDALDTAHHAGVLHRDVKPANVMLAESGRAVLTDFGIATVEDDPTLTTTGMLVGSPAYMAPERARGERPTPAADLWSLGATLFAAVEGQAPFRRDGQLPTLNAVLTEEPPPAVHGGPMRPVIARLLARDPAARPTATQARELLLRAAWAADADAETTDVLDDAPTVPVDEPTVVAAPPAPPVAVPQPDTPTDAEPEAVAVKAAVAEPEQIRPDVDHPTPRTVDPRPSVATQTRPPMPVSTASPPPVSPPDSTPVSPPDSTPVSPPVSPPVSTSSSTSSMPASPPARRRRTALLVVACVIVLALAAFGLPRLLSGGGPAGGSATPSTSATGSGQGGAAGPGGSTAAGSSTSSTDDSGGSGHGSGSGSTGGTSGSTSGGTSTGGSGGSAGSGGGSPAVPAGFRRYTDPTGFSLVIPTGWTVTRKGSDVTFHQPGGRAYLLVPQTTQPAADSLKDWQDQEAAASPRFPGYQRIRLERISFHRGWDVADWEFRWTPSGGTLHVLDRNLRISDRRAYALYWSVPEQDWAGMWRTFTVIANSFRPAS